MSPGHVTITEAIKVFLASREGAKIAPATLRKYRTFTKQLTDFAESRGYVNAGHASFGASPFFSQ